MNKTELIKRYLFFLAGLFVNSFGVAFITKANLGTSPISSIPCTLSLGFRPTLGMFTLYMSLVLIAVQLLLLRKKFPKKRSRRKENSFTREFFIRLQSLI